MPEWFMPFVGIVGVVLFSLWFLLWLADRYK